MKILHLLNASVLSNLSGYTLKSHAILACQRKLGLNAVAFANPNFNTLSLDSEKDGISYLKASLLRQLFFIAVRKAVRLAGKYDSIELFNFKYVLKQVVRQTRPDIIHAHSAPAMALAAAALSKQRGISLVYEIRGLQEESGVADGDCERDSKNYINRRASETAAMRGADHVISICHSLKADLVERKIAEEKISVIGNGVDTDRFCPMPRNMNLAKRLCLDNHFVIGYISSLRKLEGVVTLLKALPGILAANARVKLLIVGSGPELENLKALAKAENLLENVVFAGSVSHDAVIDYYSLIDVFVVPRIDEKVCRLVTPLKPYEAMAMGKTVLVSDLPALREIIDSGQTGLTFRAGDPEALANKTVQLLNDPPLMKRLGDGALEFVRAHKDWDTIARQYAALYQDLIQSKR